MCDMQNDLAILFRVTLSLYGECARKAARNLKTNWRIIPGTILAYFVFTILATVVPALVPGIAGQLLMGFVYAALLTQFYSWLGSAVRHDRLLWNDLIRFDGTLFGVLMGIGFVFFLAELVVESWAHGTQDPRILFFFNALVVVIFNAVPEVAYHHHFQSIHALGHSLKFIQTNWVEWFVPYILFLIPVFVLGFFFVTVLGILAVSNPLLPLTSLMYPWTTLDLFGDSSGGKLLGTITSLTLGLWFMLFRGHLFLALDTGSRRQRIFQGRR
jgi:MFS family permease